ncbi:Helix-turn-helix domain-containing protein [Bifidobacterium adolescentis]|uniref:Helix-turn-helix domain-containing protein n=3 Tax=Bifidobacterium adolescentis TaxID=1680 RepID=A0A1X2ZK77_BIFAD|nr:Helix-turn-helix domain-containing protein [Bifidobacterium adolescentis]OSG96939.1 Helix-turn-helix domain-containing protein [Bifidobacterium adolescentis]
MGRYTHLTLTEREEIMLLAHEGGSHGDIASATGGSQSTISREIAGTRSRSCGDAATARRPRNTTTSRAGLPT